MVTILNPVAMFLVKCSKWKIEGRKIGEKE